VARLNKLYNIARSTDVYGYAASLFLVAVVTLTCELLRPILLPINFFMFYLLAVVLAALRIGLKPAVATVVLSGFMYNYLYVPPRFVFDIREKEYLVTFFGLLITGVVISSLVTKARERNEALQLREAETASLYHLSRELAVSIGKEAIQNAIVNNIEESLNAQVALFLPIAGQLEMVAASKELTIDQHDIEGAVRVFNTSNTAGYGATSQDSVKLVYFPLLAMSKIAGVMAVKLDEDSTFPSDQSNRLLEAFATQTAMALERVSLSHEAGQAQTLRAQQKLERALLNSISHDFRSPLATITGVLTSILEGGKLLTEQVRRELLENAKEEATRLNRFVGNLLDITRLEARGAILKKESCDVEDLIGCALAAISRQLKGRAVDFKLESALPLVEMDMVLMNQVLINLLENALKYSPQNSAVEILARCNDLKLIIQVSDSGPGVPENELKRIFDKFYRIPVPESVKGTGLGLSICKGIVGAHGGNIWADNVAGGGFMVTVEIPLQAASQERGNCHG